MSVGSVLELSVMRRWSLTGLAWVGLLTLGAALLVSLFPGIAATHDPLALDMVNRLQSPSADHFFGTDDFGRDVYSRIIYGARYSIFAAGIVVGLGVILGGLTGIIAGYAGGWVDESLMRSADVVLAFPPILLAMVIVTALGPSMTNTVLTLVVIGWPEYARVMRAQTLVIVQQDYVFAAKAIGTQGARVVWQHILPNALSTLIVQATLNLGVTILSLAALGFLGLGAQAPNPEWGLMVSNGRNYFLDAWWYPVFPGLAIALVTLSFNLIGDSLSDVLDPLNR